MLDSAFILLIRVLRHVANTCFILTAIIAFPFLFPAYTLLGWWVGRGVQGPGRDA